MYIYTLKNIKVTAIGLVQIQKKKENKVRIVSVQGVIKDTGRKLLAFVSKIKTRGGSFIYSVMACI